ncbi:hypothetical protein Poly24_33800 [Rosistilla carotiformis]|uniref:Uncharacterized protein n=1 Tax=Rosistilla carotiformis TaxID=2528017 RepID=A0A518JVU5_9BACT|nr:hypothetical protein [Rosistilla carotiformis]QDV69663.1 hypothetical protein Poly24_33800 [Rosistilla carotiformis]
MKYSISLSFTELDYRLLIKDKVNKIPTLIPQANNDVQNYRRNTKGMLYRARFGHRYLAIRYSQALADETGESGVSHGGIDGLIPKGHLSPGTFPSPKTQPDTFARSFGRSL